MASEGEECSGIATGARATVPMSLSHPIASAYALRAWWLGDVLFETVVSDAGAPLAVDRHSHAEHQFVLPSRGFAGVRSRGATERMVAGRLGMVPAEIPHAVLRLEDDAGPSVTRMMYLPPTALSGDRDEFRSFETADGAMDAAFLRLHLAVSEGAARLEQDVRLAEFLGRLRPSRRVSSAGISRQSSRESPGIEEAREYLRAHFAENVSLKELALVARLSPNYLNAVFSREVGLPPYAYQKQLRLAEARRLIARGTELGRAALETGFADQSHLSRAFKRMYGVSPGRYGRGS